MNLFTSGGQLEASSFNACRTRNLPCLDNGVQMERNRFGCGSIKALKQKKIAFADKEK